MTSNDTSITSPTEHGERRKGNQSSEHGERRNGNQSTEHREWGKENQSSEHGERRNGNQSTEHREWGIRKQSTEDRERRNGNQSTEDRGRRNGNQSTEDRGRRNGNQFTEHRERTSGNQSTEERERRNGNQSMEERERRKGSDSLKLYVLLASMVMVYKGATKMYKTALNHHLYHRFLSNELSTNVTIIIGTVNRTPNLCYPNQTIKMDRDFAQELADKHQARLLSVASSISLLTLILFGIISDRFGRKFILLSTTLAFSIQCTLACVFIQNNADTSLYYIPYFIDGLGGSMFGFNLGCFLVVADNVTSKKERSLGLALIESLNGIGSITTEFSTLYICRRYGSLVPVILSSVSVGAVFIAVSLCLPKQTNTSTVHEKDQTQSCEDSNKSCSRLRHIFRMFVMFYFSRKYYGKRKVFWACFVIFCLVESPVIFRSDLIPLIQIGWPNCWTVSLTNVYMYLALGLNYVVAMILIIPFQYCFSDTVIAILGIVSAIAFNVTTAFADCQDLFFWGLVAGTFMIIPKPVIRSIASLRAGPDHQGALFAGFLASELLCEVISEVIYTFLYAHTHGPVSGKIFFFVGGSLCIALGSAIYLRDVTKKERMLERPTADDYVPINSSTADNRMQHRENNS